MGDIAVPPNHVALVLLRRQRSFFYLEIPLDIINRSCLHPRKYLLFLAWCILGSEGVGHLAFQPGGNGISTDGDLNDRGIYYYVPNEPLSTFPS